MSVLEQKISKPMSDDDIKKYLPDARILTTQDLEKYNDVNDLFNKNFVDYIIILFQDSQNSGHWCSLMKYGDYIEFFDSYGNSPEKVYNFAPMQVKKGLGINDNHLCKLLDKCSEKVMYNGVKYQNMGKKQPINTCGRHCCFRVLCLLGKGYTLPEYTDYMKEAKKYYKGKTWDEIVSILINQ